MTAGTLCLPCEDPEYYDELRAEYHRIFNPRDFVEHDLVDAIVVARWRETRAARYENSLIREAFADSRARNEQRYERLSIDVETALAFKALSDNSTSLENLDRYERRLRRQSVMAMRQLAEYRRNFPPSADSTTYIPIHDEMQKLQSKPIPKNEHPPIGEATEENTIQLRNESIPESAVQPEPCPAPLTTNHKPLTTSLELATDNRQLTTSARLTTDHWPLTTELTTDNRQLTTSARAA